MRSLPKVAVGRHLSSESVNLKNFRSWVGDALIDEIRELSRDLKGLRICNVNATAAGGGVAELLSRIIPIHLALGISTDWRLIYGDKDFFTITKSFHNALQGAELKLTTETKRVYLAVGEMGVDLRRPLLAQISRFDPWKDPLGVIQAYRLAKERNPEIQLAMIGAMAGDDPQGWEILDKINAEAADDPDLHLFTNLTGVGSMEVNAFQRAADVVLQKSIREGFGLVVAEAFWKSRPIVAGHAGGIPLQFPVGYEDNLVENVEDCAARILFLLEHRDIAESFGRAGQAKIR